MATISNLGVGVPGLSDLYDKLQAAEETKLTAIAKQKTTYDAQITGYGKLQSALTTLQTAAAKLAKTDTWNSTSVSSTNTAFSAISTSSANVGDVTINVSKIAKGQVLTTAPGTIDSNTKQLGGTTGSNSRTITITQAGADSKPLTVTLADGDTSLNGIAKAINAANGNVSASVVKADNGDYRLMLTSKTTGTDSDMTVTVAGDDTLNAVTIYNESHVAGWKKITDAVHAKGGRIFLQLWHVGRISHPDLQPGNALPVAPSAIKPDGNAFTESGFKPFVEPRALEASELPAIVEQYKIAAQLSLQAGFDGVEIHAANGYLLDQFLRDKTNQRTDNYGGSIENRARLLLEVVEAVTSVIPSERVGIRLSPISPANDIADSNPKALFSYVVEQLNRYKLVYLHVVEGATGGPREVDGGFDLQVLRDLFKGIYIANNGYDLEMAVKARDRNLADLVAFGRPWIANPDLVERFKAGAALAEFNQATLYGGGAEGYTDYPPMQQS